MGIFYLSMYIYILPSILNEDGMTIPRTYTVLWRWHMEALDSVPGTLLVCQQVGGF